MSEIKIPESVRSYYREPAISAATEWLLDTKNNKKIMVDSWDELPKQFQSYLAAHQIRAEFAETLWIMWNEIWGQLFENHNIRSNDFVTIEDMARSDSSPPTIFEMWEGSCLLERQYIRDGKKFNFGVDFEGTGNCPRLLFWADSKELIRGLDMGDNWLENQIDGDWRVTKDHPYRHEEEWLELDDLSRWADVAIEKMLELSKS